MRLGAENAIFSSLNCSCFKMPYVTCLNCAIFQNLGFVICKEYAIMLSYSIYMDASLDLIFILLILFLGSTHRLFKAFAA